MKLQLLNDNEDLAWLLDTHLKDVGDTPVFRSAIVFGNEDCPQEIALYSSHMPLVSEFPIARYLYTDGAYVLTEGR